MAMVTGNFKIAMDSIKASKLRSFLTMLGIIIGVISVVTIVSIGEGVKKQITNQIEQRGADLITVQPGRTVTRDNKGKITGVNYTAAFAGNALNEADLSTIQKIPGIASAVPLAFVTATPKTGDRELPNSFILGTSDKLPGALNQKIAYGGFFGPDEKSKNVAVIGKTVAESLFQETVPVGRSMQIRGQNFVVIGVFDKFDTTSLIPNADYNSAIFIPFETSKQISNGQIGIQQILVRPQNADQTAQASQALRATLQNAHGGQNDFTILNQKDNLAIASSILTLLTALISGVAAISLIVGGIGIMNVMLVAVTERTREVGVRKAVGASSQQILMQFLIEAALISLVGGIIGVFGSLLTNFFIRIFTNLQPLITLPIMGAAILMSVVVGIFFGVAPALKAARKDPIHSLRSIH